MKSKSEIAREFGNRLAMTKGGLSEQFSNSAMCDAAYSGDINNTRNVTACGIDQLRKVQGVQINKIRPYVEAVNGFMIQNRRDAKYAAIDERQDQQILYSQNGNALKQLLRKNARAEQIEAVGSKQMLIKGYSATASAMSYGEGYATRDPNGELVMADVTNECGWDPMARAPNLLDARWSYYRKSYSLKDALTLFDDSEEEDFVTTGSPPETGYRFDPTIGPKYDRSKYDQSLPSGFEWDSEGDKTVWVYFYEWYETETFYRAANPLGSLANDDIRRIAEVQMQAIADEVKDNDSLFEFNPADQTLTFDNATKSKLVEVFEALIKPYSFTRKVFYTAVLSGSKVFTSFRSLSQQGYSIKFKTGIWDNHCNIWIGMVNPMIEANKYFNRALTELMYTIAANAKGGYFVEEDAVEDIAEFERDVNRTDGNVIVRSGANTNGKIKEKKSPFAPTGYEQVLQIAQQLVPELANIDPTFMGSSENKMQTAQLQRQIVQRVASTLACYFDADVLYKIEHSRLLLDFLRVYVENNEGGVKRVIGDDGEQQFLTMSNDMLANQYDIDIMEAPQTPDDKEQQSEILMNLGTQLATLQNPAAPAAFAAAVKYMNIEASDKQELLKILTPPDDPRVTQLQQQVQQLTSEANKLQLENIHALTQAEMAKAAEKANKIVTDAQIAAADIGKTLAETEQIKVETQLAPLVQTAGIHVNA